MNDIHDPLSQSARRAWLASLLLTRRSRVMPRFFAGYARLSTLSRRARRRLRRVAVAGVLALGLAAGALAIQPPAVHAATITVDEMTCTLIDAIIAANTDTATDGCAAGDPSLDTIDLQADVLLTTSYDYYYNSDTGLPLVTSEIVIEGNGHTIERDTADPDEFRILAVNSDGDLTLNDVTISGGHSAEGGGAVYVSHGTLAINDSTISGNYGSDYGGGVFNNGGNLTITDSIVTENDSENSGGGVASYEGTFAISDSIVTYNTATGHGGGGLYIGGDTSVASITNSTISGNYGDFVGGGLYTFGGSLTITSSTFSGNTAAGRGGGLYLDGEPSTTTVTNSTVSGNTSHGDGGGIYIDDGIVTVTNSTISDNSADEDGGGIFLFDYDIDLDLNRTIVSGNSAGGGGDEIHNNGYGVITANNNNVFGHSGLTNANAFYDFTPGASDITATSDGNTPTALASILDTTLGNNGGPTETHNLVANSPAVDMAPDADCTADPTDAVDQRGAPRPFDVPGQGNDAPSTDTCDAGAVEYGSPVPGAAAVFVSATTASVTADGLSFGPHDILAWDGSEWSKWFDGSAAGLTPNGIAKHNINAFFISDPAGESALMSFAQNARKVPGIPGKVDGTDVVAWDGNVFEPFVDGSDVGLTDLTQEKIDALHALDGADSPINGGDCFVYLLVSTAGPGKVPNHSGGTLNFSGEDVLGFCATSLGPNTAGKWHMVLDGSDQGMPRNSTDSISLSADGQTLYLTTKGTFDVDDATGGHSMVYAYDLTTTTFTGPLFIAADAGLGGKVDGLQVEGDLP